MEGFAAPFFVASALLALAGGAKLARPTPTVGALRSVGLPANRTLAQALGLAEVVVGSIALIFGGPLVAGFVAGSYLAFAGFIVLALSKGGAVASCGCFGTADSPPTIVHLVLNTLAAFTAVGAALGGIGGITEIVTDQPAFGLPFIGFVALGTWFAYLALSVLPTLIPAETTP